MPTPTYNLGAFALAEGIANSATFGYASNLPTITFPQEEVVFGRDVTIDGVLISLFYWATQALVLTFSVNGNTLGSINLPAVAGPLPANPTLYKLQCANFTATSPQLTVSLTWYNPAISASGQFQIAKVSMFATLDPNQRPV